MHSHRTEADYNLCSKHTMDTRECDTHEECTPAPTVCIYEGEEENHGWSRCHHGEQRRILRLRKAVSGKCAQTKNEVRKCLTPCKYSMWKLGKACSKQCGTGGVEVWHRHLILDEPCSGDADHLTQKRPCSGHECPIDCTVNNFELAISCNATCGSGVELWTRSIATLAQFGGKCTKVLNEFRHCEGTQCPVSCKLGSWQSVQQCNTTCGRGVAIFRRKVEAGDCGDQKLTKTVSCVAKKAECDSPKPRVVKEDPIVRETGASNVRHVTCLDDTDEECSFNCPWCRDDVSWEEIERGASNLVFFRVRKRGRLERSPSGPGWTRFWDKDSFHVSGGMKTNDCRVDSIRHVRQIVSRDLDPHLKCETRFIEGENHLVSGACVGTTFYIDECGVRFQL